jgi:hypothetical protein
VKDSELEKQLKEAERREEEELSGELFAHLSKVKANAEDSVLSMEILFFFC